MMKELIWAEHQKLRRSKIVLVAIFAVIMVAIIVFTQGQFSFGEKRYIDDAGWFMNAAQSLATFFVLPAVIALLGSYMICREEQEDTINHVDMAALGGAAMSYKPHQQILTFFDLSKKARPPPGIFLPLDMNY